MSRICLSLRASARSGGRSSAISATSARPAFRARSLTSVRHEPTQQAGATAVPKKPISAPDVLNHVRSAIGFAAA
ncbi:MAG: hypothetical protein V3R74_09695 [Alphaproteobacteria bacterium]